MEAEVKVLAAAVVLVGSLGAVVFAQGTTGKSLPRVYVFTQAAKPGQPAVPGQEARRASVDDLKTELRKKPGLLLVADIPLDADVVVEVLRREVESPSRCVLTVRLRAAGQSSGRQFQGEGATWKDATTLVADAVRRWVNEMYEPTA